jgi:hypothetical protein
METLGFAGAAIIFLAIGLVLVLYENRRIKAGRPILKGGVAAQSYYIIYFAMFVMALATGIKAFTG